MNRSYLGDFQLEALYTERERKLMAIHILFLPIVFYCVAVGGLHSMEFLEKLVAHRGANNEVVGNRLDKFPENSLEAMREAYRVGVQYVECDVQITRDDQVIVLHDDTLRRTAKYSPISGLSRGEFEQIGRADVERLTFAEISKFNVGNERINVKIPLLDEFLDEVDHDKSRKLLIEIKRGGERMIQALKKCLNRHPDLRNDQILVISFDLEMLSFSKKIFPKHTHIFLLTSTAEENEAYLDPNVSDRYLGLYHRIDSFERLPYFIELAKKRGVDGLSFEYTPTIDQKWMQKVHEAGLMTYIWNYPQHDCIDVVIRMLECGADLIATNQPEKIITDYSDNS